MPNITFAAILLLMGKKNYFVDILLNRLKRMKTFSFIAYEDLQAPLK